ncbi:MAG: hypothetical protein WBP08_15670 [Saprospiraceae bacterium]
MINYIFGKDFQYDIPIRISSKHKVTHSIISTWKKEFLSNAAFVFEKGKPKKIESVHTDRDELVKTIGEQKEDIDFIKKIKETGMNMMPLIHLSISITPQHHDAGLLLVAHQISTKILLTNDDFTLGF